MVSFLPSKTSLIFMNLPEDILTSGSNINTLVICGAKTECHKIVWLLFVAF